MTFPETVSLDFALLRLEGAMKGVEAPPPQSLPCDRWLARSTLQKAIRRGDVEVAQRAACTLMAEDRKSVWRHMVTIALEDVGVGHIALVNQIVAAARDRQWRAARGEWLVISYLVQAMAAAAHCQAACDLLMRAQNCPKLQRLRADAADASVHDLSRQLRQIGPGLDARAVAALAIAGELGSSNIRGDPGRVLGCLGEGGCSPEPLAIAHAAWLATRNPMALLLPLVWQAWEGDGVADLADDDLPPTRAIRDIPDYAVDRFTRAGATVLRKFIAREPSLKRSLDQLDVPSADQWKVLGDILFVIEGGLVTNRLRWSLGESLRRPVRPLAGIIKLGDKAEEVAVWLRPRLNTISELRDLTLPPAGLAFQP